MKKQILLMGLIVSSSFLSMGGANAYYEENDFEDYVNFFEEIPVEETLMFHAKEINSKAGKQDVSSLATGAVNAAYGALKFSFENGVQQRREQLAGLGAVQSSAFLMAHHPYARGLASAIINQINVVAQKLTPQQRQQFWVCAETKIKASIEKFCQQFGGPTPPEINQHIASQITLKKIIG